MAVDSVHMGAISSGWHYDPEQDAYCIGSGCSWNQGDGNGNSGASGGNNNQDDEDV